ncbi:MAG: carbon-phosphorus lyase complex subunit PhnI [Spirochaetia bacterium]|jgi:alpha-D-ribose 1-methylphosphonate 5-triphosphate synthase subunit PhnI
MGYVAVQGGITAIENSQKLNRYLRLRGSSAPVSVAQIMDQMGPLVDRVMSEGGLYSPFHAALALKQASGDPLEASFLLRAYRSTLRRMVDSLPVRTDGMRILRRISSAFKTIPGGQVLGSTSDYEQRILDFSLAEETEEAQRAAVRAFAASVATAAGLPDAAPLEPERFRKVVSNLREQGLVAPSPLGDPGPPTDITQESTAFPLDRSGRLQMLARAETGGVLALAYSSMRGYGSVHPTVAELRVGRAQVRIPHPFRKGEAVALGSIVVTEVEIVASVQRLEGEETPTFSLGYGACFGHNEVKAISTAVLDRAMKSPSPKDPAEDQEFVLLHTDGIESSGFCSHFKLPHYVTFQADLDRLRDMRGDRE